MHQFVGKMAEGIGCHGEVGVFFCAVRVCWCCGGEWCGVQLRGAPGAAKGLPMGSVAKGQSRHAALWICSLTYSGDEVEGEARVFVPL